MAKRLRPGDVIPEFRFDTPYRPQRSFYELVEGEKPVFLVFLRNFGHPLTRHYVMEYIKSAPALRSARLACVVRTKPQVIAKAIPEGAMPCELICDAEGVLYRFFDVRYEKSRLKCYSLTAMKILNAAKKQGYAPKKGEPEQLPLTLLVGPAGRVLLAHYGATLTDLPEDCTGMEELAADLLPTLPPEWLAAPAPERQAPGEPAGAGAAPVGSPAAAPAGQDAPDPGERAPEAESFDTPIEGLDAPAAPAAPADVPIDPAAGPPAPPSPPKAPGIDLSALGFGPGR